MTSEIPQSVVTAKEKRQRLREEYRLAAKKYREEVGAYTPEERGAHLSELHSKAVAFFTAAEDELLTESDCGLHEDDVHFTAATESAINDLETIAKHFNLMFDQAPRANRDPKTFFPSAVAYGTLQRIAAHSKGNQWIRIKDEFTKLGLPTGGFDTPMTESPKTTNAQRVRDFAVGCALLGVAVGFAIWGFNKGTLTDDQRQILLWILPLASGFGCRFFAGAISAKAKGIIPGLIVTATGGFAVWMITIFLLFPKS